VEANIVFFDGMCNFCSSSVNFIIKRDKHSYFHFALLQSTSAELIPHIPSADLPDSIILLEKGKYYFYSTAALRIARRLIFPWNLFYVFIVIPAFLRDPVYRWFASKRYKWFGVKESCFIPEAKDRDRFEILKGE
jgi:predicted DCC family thiol-disulfide oxidoreductase YuxK